MKDIVKKKGWEGVINLNISTITIIIGLNKINITTVTAIYVIKRIIKKSITTTTTDTIYIRCYNYSKYYSYY